MLVFCYNRPSSLKNLLVTLVPQLHVQRIRLWVFRDGPKTLEDRNKQRDIERIIQQELATIAHTFVARSENLGLAQSIIRGVTEASDCVSRLIVLEDDLVLRSDAIEHFRTCLDLYESQSDVFSISGFIDASSERRLADVDAETFLCRRPATWGWATWANVWRQCSWDRNHYHAVRQRPASMADVRRLGADVIPWLDGYLEGQIDSWGIRWTVFHALNGGLSVYPTRTRIVNMGFGLEGTNTLFGGPNASDTNRDTLRRRVTRRYLQRIDHDLESAYLGQFFVRLFRWRVIIRKFALVGFLKRWLVKAVKFCRSVAASSNSHVSQDD